MEILTDTFSIIDIVALLADGSRLLEERKAFANTTSSETDLGEGEITI